MSAYGPKRHLPQDHISMSASGGKADSLCSLSGFPLLTLSGHRDPQRQAEVFSDKLRDSGFPQLLRNAALYRIGACAVGDASGSVRRHAGAHPLFEQLRHRPASSRQSSGDDRPQQVDGPAFFEIGERPLHRNLVGSRPLQVRPPPTGPAARPSGMLHCLADGRASAPWRASRPGAVLAEIRRPSCPTHRSRRCRPAPTTLANSATPLAGSGTKKITSAITAASNLCRGREARWRRPGGTPPRVQRCGVRANASWASDGSIP